MTTRDRGTAVSDTGAMETMAQLEAQLQQLEAEHQALREAHAALEAERQRGAEALHESEERARRQREAIAELLSHEALATEGVEGVARLITESAARAMRVERVSVWLLTDEARQLELVNLFESSSKAHSKDHTLRADDYPRYFEALKGESRIATVDAQADPRTQEFTEGYLVPLGITGLIDAEFSLNGKLAGVVCFEHVGAHRTWHPDEEAFAASMASLMGQALADVASRKAQEALRESNELFARFLRHTPVYAYIKSVTPEESRVLLVSDNFKQMVGVSPEDMVGKTMAELFPPDLAASMTADDWAVVTSGEVLTRDEELNGRSYTSIKFPIVIADKTLLAGYTIDLTDRKRAADAVRQSREMLQLVIDAVPQSVFWKDVDGRYLGCNRIFASHTGLDDPTQVVGRTDFDLPWPREEAEAYRADDAEVIRTNEPKLRLVEPIQRSDGTRIWGETSKVPLRGHDGRPFGVLGVYDDITERKRAEEALRESRATLAAALASMTDAVFVADLEGRLLEFNDAFATFHRFSSKAECPLTLDEYAALLEMVLPDGQVAPVESWAALRALRGETVTNAEYELRRLDTGERWAGSYSFSPIRQQNGEIVGAVVVARDITERRRAEEDKAKLEARLQQAERMESVGRLAGGVAHDFNNMLGVILGHVEMAMEVLGSSHEVYEDLREIRGAAERSAHLTRQLLAFARRQTVAPQVLDLNETVNGVLRMLGRLIGESIDLTWNPAPGLWRVKIDPSQVDQLLANLCVNARDAIAGVGRIVIETANCTIHDGDSGAPQGVLPGQYVRLRVSDDGCGMDADTAQHVFEPFFTTKGLGKGTGLGLATVYGIVTQNNGAISVDSAPARGTTFTIYLPRWAGEMEAVAVDTTTRDAVRGRETILLVEDEPAILKMTTKILERQGYTVIPAETPGEAIRLARERSGEIHLLITDVVMPEMNGRDLARNLLGLYPHIRRLFTSGYTADVIAHHGVLDEGVMFIQKPFTRDGLAAKVREVLDRE